MVYGDITSTKCLKVDNLTGVEWKRVTVATIVYEDYVLLATECGKLNLLSRAAHGVIDSVNENYKITAMCHVCEHFVIMSHEGGYLSCWDVKEGKLVRTAMIKNLAAGEITRITNSPNKEEREVMLASNRGCIFARVSDKGYIVEELFEIYFQQKQLNFVGWINFKNYFATTRSSKQVLWFQRGQDNNHDFKVRELRLIEWTNNYQALLDESDADHPTKWMLGASGTKLYIHNF